jgi:hypothetical protein
MFLCVQQRTDVEGSCDTGTLNKVKISSKGAVQLHRDVKLNQASTLGISMALNALDMSQVPDIGISFDHSP